ncbi:DUF6477 family protein [Sinisalibacter lacisalsi]|uniref:Uncharacterized protein n=1 Tax=Sinisalibacter lacisalsi TaxID=1526570 RepID=A0ABQ1QM71_9RHOB|nr:DUF6477 family protein [Sinisalibacter lacisalsi]GGD31724.1 hypothetical protein GCM10011358_14730 [Sinisalibacter lacisalsi]
MTDVTALLAALRRPRLLIRAARFGLADYNRERDLKRLMHLPAAPGPRIAVDRLLRAEAEMETRRKQGVAAYSPARHVEILIALMAEARLLPRPGHEA